MLLASYGRSFIVQATVVKYDHTVITSVNYDHKTFIVQSTGLNVIKLVTNVCNMLRVFVPGRN
jgi:hypothetical protein